MVTPPPLEMLWESDDPREVLAERFGFSDAGDTVDWVVATVREHWNLRVTRCDRIVMSDSNALAWLATPSGAMLAKWSVDPLRFPRLISIAALTHRLASDGHPVSAPIPTTSNELQVEVEGTLLGLQKEINGTLLDVQDAVQVRAAGSTLARLHQALATYPAAHQLFDTTRPPQTLTERVVSWLGSAGEHVPRAALDVLRAMVADAPSDGVPAQLVHGDFRSANILCDGAKIEAVLDFEDARFDHRIDEIARSAVMLGTRFRGWGPVTADVRAEFLAGYRSVHPLTPAEATWWDILVLWYAWALVPPTDDPTGWGAAAHEQLAMVLPR